MTKILLKVPYTVYLARVNVNLVYTLVLSDIQVPHSWTIFWDTKMNQTWKWLSYWERWVRIPLSG